MRDTVLILTNTMDPHADVMVQLLNRRNVPVIRFDPGDIPAAGKIAVRIENSVWRGEFETPDITFSMSQIKSIWHRRPTRWTPPPGDYGDEIAKFMKLEREHAFGGVWESTDCLWVNHPTKNFIANWKPFQLKLATQMGLEIPRTVVTNDPAQVIRFRDEIGSEIVFKTLTPASFESRSQYTHVLKDNNLELTENMEVTPGIYQQYVAKDFELRVTVIGDQVFSAALYSQENDLTKHDWRLGQSDGLRYGKHELPALIKTKCVALVRGLGLNFGAIDMIVTPEEHHVFLEINPSGQFGFIEQHVDYPLFSTLADLLEGTMPVTAS